MGLSVSEDVPVLSVKSEPELRHVLAHLWYALEAMCRGKCGEALYELKSVEGLIFFEDDESMTRAAEALYAGELAATEPKGDGS